MNPNLLTQPTFPPRAGRRERGQSMLELAGSLMFLVLLVSVTIDVGWAFYTLTSLRDTVQEASAYGAICPYMEDGSANTVLIRQRFKLSTTAPVNASTIPDNDVVITYYDLTGSEVTTPEMGGSVKVRVTVQHQILVPFLGTIINSQTYPLTAEVTNTVMRSKWYRECDF